nr:retrovirus-related Pol polyprotein from transposon TNT 1-94 [Tanacetum cinerariifolium]
MRPFGCPVTILNTLGPLGKFQGKVDEGFLVGYSVCSKAFRVFNSRTRVVQETLHVNFMKNKPNVTGSGPAWLFDIDSLSQTMNYHPVLIENQSNPTAGFQDTAKAGEEGTQTYVLFPVLSDVFAAGLEFSNSTNDLTTAGPLVSIAELNFTNNTNDFSAAGPSNAAMLNLEDLSYDTDDVGTEADTNNMESIISEEPKRVHQALKDPSWIEAMQEELLQFKMQKVWEEGIDCEEVFAPIERIEAIGLFLAYASFMGFMMYQM